MKVAPEATLGIGCVLTVVPLAFGLLFAGGMLGFLILLVIVPMGLALMTIGAFEWGIRKVRGGDVEPPSEEFSWEPSAEEVMSWVVIAVLALYFYWLFGGF